ncbi:hypothetical protein [Algivirga pacifica]|uniref:ATPase n=1 Tax=Algivirga pacifica TaxID=1162670 RepID=A0ABP9D6K8_9BACT
MLENQIKRYKHRYYLNAILKGSILALTLVLSYFLLINTLESLGSFGKGTRAFLFFSFLGVFLFSMIFWVLRPLYPLINQGKQISDTKAAKQIGKSFPNISDKLLNTLQIINANPNNDLVKASAEQRHKEFKQVDFAQAIDYRVNTKYLRYLFAPFLIILLITLIRPQFFTANTEKIVNFEKEFIPKAPFNFNLLNHDLTAFRNEGITITLNLSGDALPNDAFIETSDGRKFKMVAGKNGNFEYEFKKIQKGFDFRFTAVGYHSHQYTLKVLERPSLNNFIAELRYPKYIGKKDETISNTGNLTIPEGTEIKWLFETQKADQLQLLFQDKEGQATDSITTIQKGNLFEYTTKAKSSMPYSVKLQNEFSTNKEAITYYLDVVKDEFPSINMKQYEDTVLYSFLALGGNVTDDYGIRGLNLKYRVREEGSKTGKFQKIKIPFNQKAINQSFYYRFDIEALKLKDGETMDYYVEVWDNDGVNGWKRSKTAVYQFKFPDQTEMKKTLAEANEKTSNSIDKTLKKSEKLQQKLENIQNKLKGRKQLTWQDKKELSKLLDEKKALDNELQKLQEQYQLSHEKQEKFGQQNDELLQKSQELEKLMDELLDEETKELYEELNKLLEQNYINQNLQDNLENLNQKQKNLKNELDRALELFKKLKVEQKADQIIKDLKDLSKEQDELSKETEKAKDQDLKESQDKQDKLNKEFEELQEEMKELNQMNKELENPQQDFEEFKQEQQNISKDQENAQKQLQQGQKKNASQSQKNAAKRMERMAKNMEQSMQSSEMETLQENYDDLRQIMDNLIRLSFEQETLMKEFKTIKRIDPRFVTLSQEQLKLKDDAHYIEDSLMALSKRVFEIQSFVTREVTEMNKYMDESVDAIKRRVPELASSKQQFAMTSINNLALLLNDILDKMQMQMSQNMSGKQMKQKQQGSPSLSDLQKQLNQQIQDLKKSGKSGRQLSEELAKLAAQQEMIRNALKQQMGEGGNPMQMGEQGKLGKEGKEKGTDGKEGGKEGGNSAYDKLMKEMEKTEEDLVNKQLTEDLIRRQKEIMTRLLESEKASKERELDNKRKAETAKKQLNSQSPPNFDEYLKKKEMQIELLRTIPTSLSQYYKQQVNKYFEKIKK